MIGQKAQKLPIVLQYQLLTASSLRNQVFRLMVFIGIASSTITLMNFTSKTVYASCADNVPNDSSFREDAQCPRDINRNPMYLAYDITNANGHTIAKISLHDSKTGEVIKYPTLQISINETRNLRHSILNERFQAPNGTLTLDFVHINNTVVDYGNIAIHADQDPFTKAWVSYSNGKITITNFPLSDSKTYLVEVSIIGLENPRNIYVPSEVPSTNFTLSNNDSFEGRAVVVPEFEIPILSVAIASMLGMVIVSMRYTNLWTHKRKS